MVDQDQCLGLGLYRCMVRVDVFSFMLDNWVMSPWILRTVKLELLGEGLVSLC